MNRSEHRSRTAWIGIPSVPPERAVQAIASFYLAMTAAIAIDVWLITHNHRPETWQLTAEMVFDDGGQIFGWALASTWPIMEVIRLVLASIWEGRIRRRAIEQGREQANRAWVEWNRRRLQAEERGEPFDEPTPDINKNGSGQPA